MKKNKGFTLIELLIVIGILAVLAVTLLLALNPAEAQKRTRDTRRMRDMATIQAILNQYLESGAPFTNSCLPARCASATRVLGAGALLPPTATITGPATGTAPQPCDPGPGPNFNLNWLRINVCPFAQTVPVPPNNGQMRSFVGTTPSTETDLYIAQVLGSDYVAAARLEAQANTATVANDAGRNTDWFEVQSNNNITIVF